MKEQKISILHISDLHFGNSKHDQNLDSLVINICNDLKNNNSPIDKIIVTGDIVDGKSINKDKEYNKTKKFFNNLKQKLNEKFNSAITENDFIIVPGNHDAERGKNDIFFSYRKFLKNFHSTDFESLYDSEYLYTKIRIEFLHGRT